MSSDGTTVRLTTSGRMGIRAGRQLNDVSRFYAYLSRIIIEQPRGLDNDAGLLQR